MVRLCGACCGPVYGEVSVSAREPVCRQLGEGSHRGGQGDRSMGCVVTVEEADGRVLLSVGVE